MTISKKAVLSVSLFILLLWGVVLSTYATPPLSPYTVTDNATDPTCAPGTANCYVATVTANNGLTATGSNVRLGGVLVQDTTINQSGFDFSITNNGTTFASGADPLNLLPLFGQAYPGIGMSTDGTTTGGLRQWISAINDGSDPITIIGNFDFANSIQAGLIIQGLDTELSSSDGVSGSSNVSLRYGDLSLSASNRLTIYPNVIQFSSFSSSRDDSGTNFPTNFLYTDGSGNLQSAPTSLLGGGSFSLASQDEGSLLTSTTTGYNFIGAGVTATESGGLITVNIPGGAGSGLTLQTNGITNTNQSLLNLVAGTNVSLGDDGLGNITINAVGGGGGGADGSIYLNDGTLTGNRILNGGGNDLTFNNLNSFNISAGNNLVAFNTDGISLQTATNGNNLILNTAAVVTSDLILQVNPVFPTTNRLLIQGLITDNTADQVLAKDSTGKSVWRDVGSIGGGGGADGSIYLNNGTLTGNRTLNGGGNSLTFNNLNNFALQTNLSGLGTIARIGIAHSDNGSNISVTGSYLNGSGNFISSSFYTGGQSYGYSSGIRTINTVTNKTANILLNPDDGISFIFTNPASGYTFPRTDGTANQILTTDGAGQLSWQNAGTFSLASQDEGSMLTTTTNTYNFTGAGVTATNSGGLVTVNIPNNSTNIYNSSGVLTSNRTVTGANNTLDFFSMGGFSVATSAPSNIFTSLGLAPGGASFQFTNNNTSTGGGLMLNPTSGLFLSEEDNGVTNGTATLHVKGDTGITFEFSDQAGDGFYLFPRNIGASGQVLTTNGAGQLSWQTAGANRWSLTGNSGTIAGTNFIGTTDPEDFVIKVNNVESGRFTNSTEFNQYSVFLGHNAGVGASSAHRSNFFGRDSGGNAINASGSNFLGELSGYEAINASGSNFIGAQSGRYATNANYSNFFGDSAGYSASEANNSIFIGRSAGSSANFASNSIFLGQQAGMNDIVNNTGNPDDFSILIGKSTSTGGFSNSIAIGGSAINTASNQFMIGSATRPIDKTKIIGSAGTECTITTGTGMACTSDQTLKTNILDLTTDTLEKLLKVKTVTYNWLQNPDSPKQIGFLAQDLEQYFPELVTTDSTGKKAVYYSQITPILVEAIREMNLNITELSNTERPNTWRDTLIAWFESTTNGIRSLVVHDKICVDDQCLTKDDIKVLLQMKNGNTGSVPNSPPSDNTPSTPDPLVCTAPQVLNQAGDTCIDPEPTQSEETPPTETPSAEEPTPTE